MTDDERDHLLRKLAHDVGTIKDVALVVIVLVIVGGVWLLVEGFRQGASGG